MRAYFRQKNGILDRQREKDMTKRNRRGRVLAKKGRGDVAERYHKKIPVVGGK